MWVEVCATCAAGIAWASAALPEGTPLVLGGVAPPGLGRSAGAAWKIEPTKQSCQEEGGEQANRRDAESLPK
eukprot:CAMPEP_0114232578 /NCGR_PEP_ID=MMETSP0058-20121206/4683_1 /TAXON_ID=36894 /ORGANISM="Pyramimonas parkeae, CCMP726" /LENGTH=71 /DNA_ID=CAMNT_0001344065 /DNA_START=882 /DNA_END=1097 /DNA_ORIENTATION=+